MKRLARTFTEPFSSCSAADAPGKRSACGWAVRCLIMALMGSLIDTGCWSQDGS
jgi:hypothetical protein